MDLPKKTKSIFMKGISFHKKTWIFYSLVNKYMPFGLIYIFTIYNQK